MFIHIRLLSCTVGNFKSHGRICRYKTFFVLELISIVYNSHCSIYTVVLGRIEDGCGDSITGNCSLLLVTEMRCYCRSVVSDTSSSLPHFLPGDSFPAVAASLGRCLITKQQFWPTQFGVKLLDSYYY